MGKKTGPTPTDRGKSGVKRRLLTEGQGVPIGLVAEGAQRQEMQWTRPTIERLIVERPKPTKEHPQGRCLDAGDDYDEVYAMLKEFGKTRARAPAWGRGQSDQAGCRRACTQVGRGAGALLDESLPPSAGSLGEEPTKLPGVSAFRLRFDCLSGGWVIWIGFKYKQIKI